MFKEVQSSRFVFPLIIHAPIFHHQSKGVKKKKRFYVIFVSWHLYFILDYIFHLIQSDKKDDEFFIDTMNLNKNKNDCTNRDEIKCAEKKKASKIRQAEKKCRSGL